MLLDTNGVTYCPLLKCIPSISVFVANNNVMAEVVKANIPAVNGWIHIIDRVLTVPYESVVDILATKDDVRCVVYVCST